MNSLSRTGGMIAAIAFLVAWSTPSFAQTADEILKCQRAIVKEATKFVKGKTKALQKCEEGVLKGKHSDPCPCPGCDPGTTGLKTQEKIDKAISKLDAGIAKKCGGSNKTCDGLDVNEVGGTQAGFASQCPNFENGSCNGAIGGVNNCSGVATCIECIAEAAVDQAVELYYADLVPLADPNGADKPLSKCQQTIGKETAKYLLAKEKILGKCWDARLKGKHSAVCPNINGNPNTEKDVVKAGEKIAKAESKKIVKICKACGGDDKECDDPVDTVNPGVPTLGGSGGTGEDADFDPSEIWTLTECPKAIVPPGPARGAVPCERPINTLADLVFCVDCVTEFKVDCVDPARIPVFQAGGVPGECNLTPTPTATTTPTPTFTPLATKTVTPTPTPTLTPCPLPSPTGACPSKVQIDADEDETQLDSGFTGLAHDASVTSMGRLTATVSGCDSPTFPCGQCNLGGPVANAGGGAFNNRRCTNNTFVQCTADSQCTPGTCKFFFGPPLPLSSGNVPVCVVNQLTTGVTGTFNMESGESFTSVSLASTVFTGQSLNAPCPQCNGGLCNGGPRAGLACTVNGESDLFGNVSFDCPPLPGGNAGTLPVNLNLSTQQQTVSVTTDSPLCTQTGFGGKRCLCDTCNHILAGPCQDAGDCPASNGSTCKGGTNNGQECTALTDCPDQGSGTACNTVGICGGLRCLGGANAGKPCDQEGIFDPTCTGAPCGRRGEATRPNFCTSEVCDPNPSDTDTIDEGICPTGPFDFFCSIDTYLQCDPINSNLDCRPAGEGGTCSFCKPGLQTCDAIQRQCFTTDGDLGDDVTVTGDADVPCGGTARPRLGTMFCIAPTESSSVNAAGGLPGLGRLAIIVNATLLP